MQRGTVFVVWILEQNISKRSQNTMNLFPFAESQIFFLFITACNSCFSSTLLLKNYLNNYDFDFNEDLQFLFII